jgi:tetraacyldisaccharide 4'-kinase
MGCLPIRSLPHAVISIGNITVGGTGKTPTSVWLAQALADRGYRVAILTRGYQRSVRTAVIIEPDPADASPAKEAEIETVGDEPWMMAKLFGQKVAVGRDRYEAATCLLQRTEIDVFIMDDGFQHRQLRRDVDLLLVDERDQGWLLPAGPLREPVSALDRADFILVTGAKEKWASTRRNFSWLASAQMSAKLGGRLLAGVPVELRGRRKNPGRVRRRETGSLLWHDKRLASGNCRRRGIR